MLAFERWFLCVFGVRTLRAISHAFLHSVGTLVDVYFLSSNTVYFKLSSTFFFFFSSFYLEALRVHISRYSLDVNLYNFVRSCQLCIFSFYSELQVKIFIIPNINPNNDLRYVYPHSGSFLWLQILFFNNIYLQ